MRRIIFIFLLVIVGAIVHAQQSYDASLIPAPLLTHASAVVRNEEMTVNVEDLNSTIVHVKKAVTVLTKMAMTMRFCIFFMIKAPIYGP